MALRLAFYNAVFQLQAEVYDDGERLSAVLWMIDGQAGCSLTKTAGFRPGLDGIWVYIHCSDPLDEVLERVEAAGGTILTPHTPMGASGAYTASRIPKATRSPSIRHPPAPRVATPRRERNGEFRGARFAPHRPALR